MKKRQVVVRRGSGSSRSCITSVVRSVRYGECQKNHAANIGGHAVDGCREFMANGEEGTKEALTCAACGCHRNFHKRQVDEGGAIRQELYYLLKDEKDVHFTFGSVGANGINQAGQGMASSKFCLNIAGDTPSSNRLFDAIATQCVPVIISDDIELAFEDVLDYSEFCIFVRASDAVKKGYLLKLLRGIKQETWTRMWERLKEIEKHFEYQFPSRPDDAIDMIWGIVSRKLFSTQNKVNRGNRYRRSELLLKTT